MLLRQLTCATHEKGVIEILRTLIKINSIDPGLFWKLFDSQIEPLISYSAEIWGLYTTDTELVHTFAMKRFLGVPLHTSNKVLYGECGRYPLYIKNTVECIKYWLKVISLPNTRLCKQRYDMLLIQLEKGKENWAYCIKKVFE